MNDTLTDKLTDIYYFTQYGKLMPGFIHNINGKITGLDSKIQLAGIKIKMKEKKLLMQKEQYSEETFAALQKEYQELGEQFEGMKVAKNELNSLMSMLNRKISGERAGHNALIDITSEIKAFHEFFQFYKRYKHNTRVEFDFDGSANINMKQKDFNFLLFAVVKNGVDATYGYDDEQNIIKYTVTSHQDGVELQITNSGKLLREDQDVFQTTDSDKVMYRDEVARSDDSPLGAGLDLFFLKQMLASYPDIQYSLASTEDKGTTFSIKFLKNTEHE